MSLLSQNVDGSINNKEPVKMLIYGEPGVSKSSLPQNVDRPTNNRKPGMGKSFFATKTDNTIKKKGR